VIIVVVMRVNRLRSVIKINKLTAALRWTCCLCTVGQVVHTLPEGAAVYGVTSLGDEVFVLRERERDQVEVYDVITYRLMRCLTVADAGGCADMTSCEHHHCVYIADHVVMCIHRVDVQGAITQWPVNDQPTCLSVNKAHNVLVTCDDVHKIKEFNSHGVLIRQLTLPGDVINLWHAIQLTTDQFVVCHGSTGDPLHRVIMMSADTDDIIHTHGREYGGLYDVPVHLAVDDNEFVFVVDVGNRRVMLLSPTLNYIRQVVSRDKLKWEPCRLHLDGQRRRLYVTDNEWKNGDWTTGRVVVFSV